MEQIIHRELDLGNLAIRYNQATQAFDVYVWQIWIGDAPSYLDAEGLYLSWLDEQAYQREYAAGAPEREREDAARADVLYGVRHG